VIALLKPALHHRNVLFGGSRRYRPCARRPSWKLAE
jgi:hypothetical protein